MLFLALQLPPPPPSCLFAYACRGGGGGRAEYQAVITCGRYVGGREVGPGKKALLRICGLPEFFLWNSCFLLYIKMVSQKVRGNIRSFVCQLFRGRAKGRKVMAYLFSAHNFRKYETCFLLVSSAFPHPRADESDWLKGQIGHSEMKNPLP